MFRRLQPRRDDVAAGRSQTEAETVRVDAADLIADLQYAFSRIEDLT